MLKLWQICKRLSCGYKIISQRSGKQNISSVHVRAATKKSLLSRLLCFHNLYILNKKPELGDYNDCNEFWNQPEKTRLLWGHLKQSFCSTKIKFKSAKNIIKHAPTERTLSPPLYLLCFVIYIHTTFMQFLMVNILSHMLTLKRYAQFLSQFLSSVVK